MLAVLVAWHLPPSLPSACAPCTICAGHTGPVHGCNHLHQYLIWKPRLVYPPAHQLCFALRQCVLSGPAECAQSVRSSPGSLGGGMAASGTCSTHCQRGVVADKRAAVSAVQGDDQRARRQARLCCPPLHAVSGTRAFVTTRALSLDSCCKTSRGLAFVYIAAWAGDGRCALQAALTLPRGGAAPSRKRASFVRAGRRGPRLAGCGGGAA